MALRLGYASPRRMLREMSSRELMGWYAFFRYQRARDGVAAEARDEGHLSALEKKDAARRRMLEAAE